MRLFWKKGIAAFLSLLMIASSVGCSYAVLGCTAYSCASCTPDEIKEQVADTIKEEISVVVPQIGDVLQQPTETAVPHQKEEGTTAANEAFLSLDRELFTWYVTSDVVTLDQYCYRPENFGIDRSSVPVTLGDFSEEAQNEWIADCRNQLERLKKMDAENLGEQNRFAYDNYVRYFENEIAYDGLFYYYEPLDEYVGLHLNLPLTFGLYEFRDITDVENYLVLLADVPRYFDQVLQFEKKRAELGIFMTETMLDSVLNDLDQVIASRSSNYLYSTIREALDDVSWLDNVQREAYYEKNDALVAGAFTDAYASLRNGLEELRPYCRKFVGAKELDEKSAQYFALKFRTESGSDLSIPDAIDFLEHTSEDLYYALMAAYHQSSQKEIRMTTGTVAGDERYLKTLITDIVPPMPNVKVTYHNIPPELQDGFSPAAYLIPASDHYTENTVLINPAVETDLMTLAHEGYPGHMFQYTYQFDLGTIPLFQMTIEPIGYAEGWAKNAEYSIAKRADMFGAADCCADVLNDNLTYLIVAMCSLKVNGQGCSKTDMIKYLEEWGLDESADLIYEMAVNMPIYYFKYVMGFSQQFELTENCRELFDFRDKDFYAEYLSWGPTYFDLLEPKMLDWATRNAAK
ncbi:MAG: DUF885 family protein [Clostridia bacterium]|nr:DUF885 family protein [Clostridia bacterium]